MMMRWRMIVRRIAVEGASNLIMRMRGVVTCGEDGGYLTFYDVRGLLDRLLQFGYSQIHLLGLYPKT